MVYEELMMQDRPADAQSDDRVNACDDEQCFSGRRLRFQQYGSDDRQDDRRYVENDRYENVQKGKVFSHVV
jgi:hypothetical protein